METVQGRHPATLGELTNDELDQIEGNREKLIGKIQERYGRNRAEAEKEVDDFMETESKSVA